MLEDVLVTRNDQDWKIMISVANDKQNKFENLIVIGEYELSCYHWDLMSRNLGI